MFAFMKGAAAEPQDDAAAAGNRLYLGADVAEEDDAKDDDVDDGEEEKEDVADVEYDSRDADEQEDSDEPAPPPAVNSSVEIESDDGNAPPPLPPTDFDTELLVSSLSELELAKTLLGRREDVLVMFRPNPALVSRAAYANLKQAAILPFTWLLMPCLVRGAHHQQRVGNALYYVLTDKGLGTVVTRTDEDPWALPRSPGFDKVFIPWDDVVKIDITTRSESCASMTTVEITYVKPLRGRASKRAAEQHIGQPESEKWMVSNPDEVSRLLTEYHARFASEGAQTVHNMRHASLESLRSIKNMVDAMLPDAERDPKRLFVAEMSQPDDAVIITLPPAASWSSFLGIVEGALGHSLGSSPRIYVLKDGAHARVTDVLSLLHDDLVLVEL